MATTAKIAKDVSKRKRTSLRTTEEEAEVRSAATAIAAGAAAVPRAFLRKYGICRLCFRQLALNGEVPGVVKASW